jgi:hypothetical protein
MTCGRLVRKVGQIQTVAVKDDELSLRGPYSTYDPEINGCLTPGNFLGVVPSTAWVRNGE